MDIKTHTASEQSSKPSNTLTIDLDKFKPNPREVRKERLINGWVVGAFGGFGGGLIGALLSTQTKDKGIRLLSCSVSAIAGIAVGFSFGRQLKTDEEKRSESILNAANSGSFEEALKKEMKKREQDAYYTGQRNGQNMGM